MRTTLSLQQLETRDTPAVPANLTAAMIPQSMALLQQQALAAQQRAAAVASNSVTNLAAQQRLAALASMPITARTAAIAQGALNGITTNPAANFVNGVVPALGQQVFTNGTLPGVVRQALASGTLNNVAQQVLSSGALNNAAQQLFASGVIPNMAQGLVNNAATIAQQASNFASLLRPTVVTSPFTVSGTIPGLTTQPFNFTIPSINTANLNVPTMFTPPSLSAAVNPLLTGAGTILNPFFNNPANLFPTMFGNVGSTFAPISTTTF